MNKPHQDIFDQIKTLLKMTFKDDIKEFEQGTHLTLADTGIWISVDDTELTIGFGLTHRHYNPDYDNINEGIDSFFNLLTKRKRITGYFKGDFCYKNKTEIELGNSNYDNLGTAMTWLFPFWKTTVIKEKFEEKLIDSPEFESEIARIKNYAQQHLAKSGATVIK